MDANILNDFVQPAFEYKTDEEQFGSNSLCSLMKRPSILIWIMYPSPDTELHGVSR